MISIKDIRIGDYFKVNRDDLCIKNGTIVKVTAVDALNKLPENGLIGSAHCHPLDDEQFDGGIWCDYLDPIHLTEEILKKNGFELDEVGDWWIWRRIGLKNGNEYIRIAFRNDDIAVYDIEILKNFNNCMLHLNDVHELQHALLMCGIKKNIKL